MPKYTQGIKLQDKSQTALFLQSKVASRSATNDVSVTET